VVLGFKFQTQNLPDSRVSYSFSDDSARVGIECALLSVYVHENESSRNPNSSTPERDRPQHDRKLVLSPNNIRLSPSSRSAFIFTVNNWARLKVVVSSFFTVLKIACV
jgi:hypothetical protein